MDGDAGSAIAGWPTVAHVDEFRQAVAALDDAAEFQGVALVGASGVGKSTLARALAATVESRGLTPRFVLGTETGRAVPLGAFSRAVSVESAHEPAVMLAAAHSTLEREENLVLVVDDAQLLDPLSATLVYQLAASGSTRLIVTIGPGDSVSDAVTALVKERWLLSVHVEPLTREQAGELTHAVLGDSVEPRLIDELYRRTAGNLLLLRGLLNAGRESGVLVHSDTGWRLQGPLRPDRELHDLLEFRLRSLAPKELEAVEILAVGELLDWQMLRDLCDPESVGRLERRGMIQLVSDGSDTVARLHHPIIGETAIRLAGVVRARQLNGLLAQALQKQLQAGGGHSRLPDIRGRIRLAQFMMHSDLSPDLDVIIRAATNAIAMSSVGYGEELARFAFDRGGGLLAALALADALSWQGRGEEAEEVLGGITPDGADELLTVEWGCVRAANLFWVCGEVEPARQLLADLEKRVVGKQGVALIEALQLSFTFCSGDVATTIETGPALCESNAVPMATVWAAVPTTWSLALAGRSGDAHRIAEVARRAATLSNSGPQRFPIGVAEVLALTAGGEHAAAEQVCREYAAMAAGVPEAEAMVNTIRGLVHLSHGALSSACAAFHDVMSALPQGFPAPGRMLVKAWCAQAEGARGGGAAAAAALRDSEESFGPQVAVFLPEVELARAWERVCAGQTTEARTHAVRAAEIARRSQMSAVEMRALHTATRFGDRSHAARLGELAGTLDTPLATAVAAHARGLADHDGDLLDAVAGSFEEIGVFALAADAAAQAAREHMRASNRGKALESSARAYRLAGQCELRSPAVDAAARPLPITDREREIAMLVAAGLSNRQIADRLCVSVRTVDGHLYRIFTKLDIDRRDQLVALITGTTSAP